MCASHDIGLVKDYLRDLPEPLFTKAMFDMMVDGLSVCLPDDPNGNSKLMFSIIECLSEINAVSTHPPDAQTHAYSLHRLVSSL